MLSASAPGYLAAFQVGTKDEAFKSAETHPYCSRCLRHLILTIILPFSASVRIFIGNLLQLPQIGSGLVGKTRVVEVPRRGFLVPFISVALRTPRPANRGEYLSGPASLLQLQLKIR